MVFAGFSDQVSSYSMKSLVARDEGLETFRARGDNARTANAMLEDANRATETKVPNVDVTAALEKFRSIENRIQTALPGIDFRELGLDQVIITGTESQTVRALIRTRAHSFDPEVTTHKLVTLTSGFGKELENVLQQLDCGEMSKNHAAAELLTILKERSSSSAVACNWNGTAEGEMRYVQRGHRPVSGDERDTPVIQPLDGVRVSLNHFNTEALLDSFSDFLFRLEDIAPGTDVIHKLGDLSYGTRNELPVVQFFKKNAQGDIVEHTVELSPALLERLRPLAVDADEIAASLKAIEDKRMKQYEDDVARMGNMARVTPPTPLDREKVRTALVQKIITAFGNHLAVASETYGEVRPISERHHPLP